MERVRRGERYWAIRIFAGLIETFSLMELEQSDDEAFFSTGNYFATKEEAEAVANKLRAVLKGADVIEMPSEKEITKQYADMMAKHKEYDLYTSVQVHIRAIEYIKSKIVK